MDFIERIFGVSLDGGSGSFEFLLLALPVLASCYLMARRLLRRRERALSGEINATSVRRARPEPACLCR